MRRVFQAAILSLGAIAISPAQAENWPKELHTSVVEDYESNLEPLFRYFHQNPELSLLESKTSERLASELRALGYDVTDGVGGTGVVAVLKNGEGPTVLVRADMDGLPVKEQSGLEYASTAMQEIPDGSLVPVMHACGHDTHMTALVGTARQMLTLKNHWSGTLILIGQPAEELGAGALNMIQDGLYERFPKPDYALGFHVRAGLPAGQVAVPEKVATSNVDGVDIIVHGVGGHGAAPHKSIDPILVASQIVVSLQSIIARNIDPLEAGVITVGTMHGGSKRNVIGDLVEMQLTVRSDSPAVREQLLDGITRVATGVANALGVPEKLAPEVRARKETYTPAVINDVPTARKVSEAIKAQIGEDRVVPYQRIGMGGEDFSFLAQPQSGTRGVFFFVGGTPEVEMDTAAPHHSPFFKVDPKPVLTTAVESMVSASIELFSQQ